jgi:hypothetical protein
VLALFQPGESPCPSGTILTIAAIRHDRMISWAIDLSVI